ncbi:hypothetical protein BA1DRAFT_00894 [Photorhabdus aegyptia]|uniref:Uncharacterized protein n=1 Tax=Photorhabdus aegyptia TaxID=2805098 RepID=A0A022PQD6_9GAMM|nr:hypothetical protein BA1DRAFT_00894 [Photorhabdus aegyptia]
MENIDLAKYRIHNFVSMYGYFKVSLNDNNYA